MKTLQKILTTAILILLLTDPLLARQVDLLDYFPHGLGDSWQYTYLNPPSPYLPGFIELQVTGIDTLQDGTRLVFVNNYSEPRWRIDSTGVYTMPMMIREAVFDAGISDTWPMYRDTLLGISSDRTLQGVDTLTLFEQDRPVALFIDEGYPFHSSPVFVQHIGYYADQHNLINNSGWKLTGAIIDGDTLGTWKMEYEERLTDWLPVAVGNLWQYGHLSIVDDGPGWTTRVEEWKVTGVDTLTDDRWIVHINDEPRFEMDFSKGEIYDMQNDHIFFKFSDMLQRYKSRRISQTDIENAILSRTYQDVDGVSYREYFSDIYIKVRTLTIQKGVGWMGNPMEELWNYGSTVVLQSYVIDGDTTGTFVSIDPTEGHVPTGITLHQNYPNPFNPSTSIRYTLPEAGPVHLEVFDITGRRVAVLSDQVMSAGSHTIAFDAAGLAGGVYLYRLSSSGQTQVRKMLLIK